MIHVELCLTGVVVVTNLNGQPHILLHGIIYKTIENLASTLKHHKLEHILTRRTFNHDVIINHSRMRPTLEDASRPGSVRNPYHHHDSETLVRCYIIGFRPEVEELLS
jgi:hypothetical protein